MAKELAHEEMKDSFNKEVEKVNIERFVDAIEKDERLELLGTNADIVIAEDGIKKYLIDELLVLRDRELVIGHEAEFPKMEVREVMEKCTTDERAKHIVGILKGEENAVRLHGITRIVGYYSRTNSWNRSKVGELRDRNASGYKLTDEKPEYLDARDKSINALSQQNENHHGDSEGEDMITVRK